jgi:hypothetical protein
MPEETEAAVNRIMVVAPVEAKYVNVTRDEVTRVVQAMHATGLVICLGDPGDVEEVCCQEGVVDHLMEFVSP